MEANARLQVEHPVTELITGIDLVREQLRVAAGESLGYAQEDIEMRGWALECRITAEDAENGFLPSLGRVDLVSEPAGPGVRLDSSLFAGMEVGPHYDSLLAKLCVWGVTREQAVARMRRALGEYHVLGVKTSVPFHQRLIEHPAFTAGQLETRFLERNDLTGPSTAAEDESALIVAALLSHERHRSGREAGNAQGAKSGWKTAGRLLSLERAGGGAWRNTF
jgi:acetyl-CoA carboxylase, biotin carboxylase subunit